ncbi:MAG: cation:proton antiporter [Anaerolineae bacterium]|nr:cation:proton antiporter [Anaerolineae bacterium]
MEHGFLNFILVLVLIIAAAKLSGYLSIRLKQPSVLGELLVGIILGPTVLNILGAAWLPFHEDIHLGETISFMAELGVILLMMLAGLDLHLGDLLRSGKVSALAGTTGVVMPLLLGLGTGLLFGQPLVESLFIGLALSATSVSISAQTLMELGVLRTRVGLALLGAAVFDDILVIVLLSAAVIWLGGAAAGVSSILMTIASMAGFLLVASLIGLTVLPWLARRVERLPINQGLVTFALVICLLYAWAAEEIGGMAAITGAFLVGLFLGRTPFRKQLESGIASLAYGFFVPIFFINIGLNADLTAILGPGLGFALVITVVAVVSKLAGCGLGGLWGGLSRRESLQLGIGMVSRGEVGLIVASLAMAHNAFSPANFATTVFMVIMATLVTPPLLRLTFTNLPETVAAAPQPVPVTPPPPQRIHPPT